MFDNPGHKLRKVATVAFWVLMIAQEIIFATIILPFSEYKDGIFFLWLIGAVIIYYINYLIALYIMSYLELVENSTTIVGILSNGISGQGGSAENGAAQSNNTAMDSYELPDI